MTSSTPRFPALSPEIDLPAVEREVLERWQSSKVFQRSLEQTASGPLWTFYEGPPTANGKPGTHHVEARVFKDLFPRYRTMKGYHVPRRAGWDCHGLPVELTVEKELGFTKRQDIETYGVAEFNARCRESALRHVADFEVLTERMGYWVDLDQAYLTMSAEYVESVWWALKQIFGRGLLVEDFRVTPYCPRDETALSDHEVAQGYEDVDDVSVYVRLPITQGRFADTGAALLVWTTTPWTLVSNAAVAVHPDLSYALVRAASGELLVLAEERIGPVLGEGAQILQALPGRELVGTRYQRPFELLDRDLFGDAHRVVSADYVTIESGSGLVHQAPAFGAEDLAVARENGLPLVNPIMPNGRFADDVPLVGGLFFKEADAPLVADLEQRGLLLRELTYRHSYPHCWRCHTPLIYYPLPSWYIRTTACKDQLLRENERTDWHPEHVKHGRYGAWLDNNVDWALSRNRFWGTPLPIWRCAAEHAVCVGSLAELSELAGRDLAGLDPHRPYVDEVTFPCRTCGEQASRVPEVIDVWFDSGSMPFAQWGAPHRNREAFEQSYPAQYICEAVDQTRGWFYSLMAVGTLLFERSSYETVLCLGLILDADGRKMSKHLGNILDPFELFDRHGADAVRWLMLVNGSPWVDRRVSHDALTEVVRKVLLVYWNTVSFLVLYANANGWTPGGAGTPGPAERPPLDRWLLAELHGAVAEIDAALDAFDSANAGRRITRFLDDLSNWYVRRSRQRFWRGDPAALATLHEALAVLTRLMAPFVPFLTDHVWNRMVTAVGAADVNSVHLASWPEADPAIRDDTLLAQVALIRRIVELGRSARVASGMRTRQPLARAVVVAPGLADLPPELRAEIADELNVGAIEEPTSDLLQVTVKPNFRALGRRFGKRTPAVAAAIATAGAPRDGRLVVEVGGDRVELAGDELLISERPREGWTVSSDGDVSVGLDLELTDELRRAGLFRDALRLVQETRKTHGLDVTDRIHLVWSAGRDDVAAALREQPDLLAQEVLATTVTERPPTDVEQAQLFPELGLTVAITKADG
jgi:isoleucyl-tRNA synthetase